VRKLGHEQVVGEILRTVPVLEEEGMRAMQHAVEVTFQRMTELAPRGETGELARDMQHSARKTAGGITGSVRPRARYARFVEGGTGEGKVVRNRSGRGYSASTGHELTAAEELANPFDAMTATGWGSKTGRPLALHMRGGVVFRQHVRGQRARHFVERTREMTAPEVEEILIAGAQRATDRLFA
jgi:hypothetical protein